MQPHTTGPLIPGGKGPPTAQQGAGGRCEPLAGPRAANTEVKAGSNGERYDITGKDHNRANQIEPAPVPNCFI